eukprot:TRINITY_DN10998_c3_g1_i1.p1 TRINITY_DN10998_c3_g1~~TRINITY_DN10998_c3_g1_i1.p1  ORF type:complete len:419 (+),score=62.67 TRINITY_DN10998_c3_g1_i1:59-1315(+)
MSLMSPPSCDSSTMPPCSIPSGTGSGVVGPGVLPELRGFHVPAAELELALASNPPSHRPSYTPSQPLPSHTPLSHQPSYTPNHPPPNYPPEEVPETLLLLPNVRNDWYQSLGATENVVLSNAVCIDVATILNIPPSYVTIKSSFHHESGTILALELFTDVSVKRLFNDIVAKGQMPLTKTTQTLREIGWLAHEDAVRHHELITRWHAGIPTEKIEEQQHISILEKLASDLRCGLENFNYTAASNAAQTLFIDHPYRGMPILCEILKRFYHSLTVQEISIQWRDLIDRYCRTQGQSATIPEPTVLDRVVVEPPVTVRPIHHSVITEKKESLMVSKAQTQVLQNLLTSRKQRLSELRESQAAAVDDDVVIYEGECGKVIINSPKKSPPPSSLKHAQLKEYTRRVVGGIDSRPPLISFDSI